MSSRTALASGTVLCLMLMSSGHLGAQDKTLTIDAIYDPDTRVDFSGSPATGLTWIDEGHYLWSRRAGSGRGRDWVTVEAVTGRAEPLFDAGRMEAALAAVPGVSRDEATRLAHAPDLAFNPSRSGALVTLEGDLYFYAFGAGRATRLTKAAGEEELPAFSPDGRLVAFVRQNNLCVVDIAKQRERSLTSDGGHLLLNGKLDWLYQEEIYGRGNYRGYWWSPDSTRLAFLRLDERPVPEFAVVDHIPYRPGLEVTNYPNAGDPNPTVRLGVARADGGKPKWADLGAYAPSDLLIVNVGWTPDGRQVLYQAQNREQTWLDLNMADGSGGRQRTVLRETTKAWVNDNGNPVWLKDGTFLWMSERSGFKHLYHYRADGSQVLQVTSGRWDVRTLYGIDEATGWIYFAGTEHSPIGRDLYRVRLDGSARTRLSRTDGTHRGNFDPTFARYIDSWSDATTPTQVRLHQADGADVRVLDANPSPSIAAYGLLRPEFLQVKTRDGFAMEAMMIKPRNFDPSKRYPVYQDTYAGPGTQSVLNAWTGSDHLFLQLLAQNGVLVWVCDNRSASGKGAESQWPVYGRLGELELQDIEDGLAWLTQQPYVDASRIALGGWSYGGFMTSYALTHSTRFAAGVIGAPVTDWRNYDSVYTERFMKTPQNNSDGYDRASAVKAAAHLHGEALLIHGTTDDNVHLQNTVQFVYELQKAGKQFEVMVYPKSRHGVTDPRLNKHLRQLMFDFVLRTVGPKAPSPPGAAASR